LRRRARPGERPHAGHGNGTEPDILDHCVCFNGAWAGSPGAERSSARDETRLPLVRSRAVARSALAEGLSVGWYVGETWHVAALTPAIEREARVTGEVPLLSTDLAGLDEAPHKILCMAADDAEIPALHRVAETFRGTCAVSFSHRHFLEVTAEGVDKARA
jgi:hydroxymethylpyrimidine pyrophosphatase-like HAD family hydrolase